MEKKNHKVDIYNSITFNSQKYRSNDKSFLIFSIVPTYRYYIKHIDDSGNLGIGAGINFFSGDRPSESHDKETLNSQFLILNS